MWLVLAVQLVWCVAASELELSIGAVFTGPSELERLLGAAATGSSSEFTLNDDGTTTFFVYRAITTGNEYEFKLINCNAGSEGGVLSYLHDEVVAYDMIEKANCRRKFGIDSITKFRVTMKNPPEVGKWAPFAAYDYGVCTPPWCNEFQANKGFAVGMQSQSANPRNEYSGQWYSFPQKGLCSYPTGTKYCTYSYEVVGSISIDELVGIKQGWKDFASFCRAGQKEYDRISRSNPCSYTAALQFWQDPCNKQRCDNRQQYLSAFVPQPVAGYQHPCVMVNSDYFGGDIRAQYAVDSSSLCLNLCAMEPTCARFTWVKSALTCYLKTDKAILRLNENCCESGNQTCWAQPPMPPTAAPIESCLFPNVDYPGGDLHQVFGGSEKQCAYECVNNAKCKSFTYVSESTRADYKMCYLKEFSIGVPDSCCTSGRPNCTKPTGPTQLKVLEAPNQISPDFGVRFLVTVDAHPGEGCENTCYVVVTVLAKTGGRVYASGEAVMDVVLETIEVMVTEQLPLNDSYFLQVLVVNSEKFLQSPPLAYQSAIVIRTDAVNLGDRVSYNCLECLGLPSELQCCDGDAMLCHQGMTLSVCCPIDQLVCSESINSPYGAGCYDPSTHHCCAAGDYWKVCRGTQTCQAEAQGIMCYDEPGSGCLNCPADMACLKPPGLASGDGYCCRSQDKLCASEDGVSAECYDPRYYSCCQGKTEFELCAVSSQQCHNATALPTCQATPTDPTCDLPCPSASLPGQCCGGDDVCRNGVCCKPTEHACDGASACYDPSLFKCCTKAICPLNSTCDSKTGMCVGTQPSPSPVQCPEAKEYCTAGGSGLGECYDPRAEFCCRALGHWDLCQLSQTCRATHQGVTCLNSEELQDEECPVACPSIVNPSLCCPQSSVCLGKDRNISYCCEQGDSLCTSAKASLMDHGMCYSGEDLKCCSEPGAIALCSHDKQCGSVMAGVCQDVVAPPSSNSDGGISGVGKSVLIAVSVLVVVGLAIVSGCYCYKSRKRQQTEGLLNDYMNMPDS